MGSHLEPGEQWMRPARLDLVPPHMRDFEGGIARLDRHHLPGDPAEAGYHLELAATVRHQLHADADPEKRASTNDYRLAQRRFETGNCGETPAAIGEGAHTRQDDPIRIDHRFRLVGDLDPRGNPNLDRSAFEGFRGRAQIARAVVDDRDFHGRLPPRTPLVDGTAPARRGSISTGCRRARARPLKQDSAMWWLFSPERFSTWRVTPADWAKAWNHSLNSSVSISPSFGRVNATFQMR